MTPFAKRNLTFAAVFILGAAPVLAGTDSDTLTVRVTVQDSCAIIGGTMDFGTYTSGQPSNLNGQGTISYVGCDTGLLTIELDGGSSGNVAGRQMSGSGGSSLSYQLYRNSARSQVWGTGAGALQMQLLEPGTGSIPVYGVIPGGQTVAAGTFTDTINITLTF